MSPPNELFQIGTSSIVSLIRRPAKKKKPIRNWAVERAGEGVRTLDVHLGKVSWGKFSVEELSRDAGLSSQGVSGRPAPSRSNGYAGGYAMQARSGAGTDPQPFLSRGTATPQRRATYSPSSSPKSVAYAPDHETMQDLMACPAPARKREVHRRRRRWSHDLGSDL